MGSPYLDQPLAGIVPGVSVAFGVSRRRHPVLAIEVSTTKQMTATQAGRLVLGSAPPFYNTPTHATHRDIIVSMLTGRQYGMGRYALEIKAGAGFLAGVPRQGPLHVENAAGTFALMAGTDASIPLSRRIALVPSLRYGYAFRDDEAIRVALGAHIFRAGAGLRMTF